MVEVGGLTQLRIGELSRRVGVPATLLRAWERRYGLLRPARSDGNFRLYTDDDVARVLAMKGHLARGHAAAEAAQLALAEDHRLADKRTAPLSAAGAIDELRFALTQFDEDSAQTILDRALALNGLEEVIGSLLLPCLRLIGDGWERGDISVAQEHFASTLVRTRLLHLAQGWSRASGPTAVLACPAGELHDVGLICFGLAMWRRGWRIVYIGQDTPVEDLRATALSLEPSLVVLSAVSTRPLLQSQGEIGELAGKTKLALGGPGVTAALAADIGGEALADDVLAAAAEVTT